MRTGLREFRDFATRGNVVDLAIAVVLGAAFGAVITSLVENLLTPLIAAIFGEPDFSGLSFTINESTFRYGAVINALLSFAFIAAAIFFLVVKPLNALAARRRQGEEPPAEPTDEVRILTEIRDALTPR
ncbi:MAG: large conductance mechanosensitive channel protein MscL [Thermoleophilia bacterium]|nr:large conductance mechanosensitive channel protein MscL [Thermoleophilia bacterium]